MNKSCVTNGEFQRILSMYPDDYIVCVDNAFGWETMPMKVDPHLYVNTDIGQIEVEPEETRMIWVSADTAPERGGVKLTCTRNEFSKPSNVRTAIYDSDFGIWRDDVGTEIRIDFWMEIPGLE